jgi:hypothetical protein
MDNYQKWDINITDIKGLPSKKQKIKNKIKKINKRTEMINKRRYADKMTN